MKLKKNKSWAAILTLTILFCCSGCFYDVSNTKLQRVPINANFEVIPTTDGPLYTTPNSDYAYLGIIDKRVYGEWYFENINIPVLIIKKDNTFEYLYNPSGAYITGKWYWISGNSIVLDVRNQNFYIALNFLAFSDNQQEVVVIRYTTLEPEMLILHKQEIPNQSNL